MHRKTLCTVCAILSTAAPTVYAASAVTVPNTFVAGTAAKAADVNANFAAVAGGVNANAQNIATLQTSMQSLQNAQSAAIMPLIVKDSAGHVVGPYIQIVPDFIAAPTPNENEGVFIRTPGASFVVRLTNQSLGATGGSLGYTTPDCTGTAYVVPQGTTWSTRQTLYYATTLNTTAYVFHWSAVTSVTFASRQTFDGTSLQCASFTAAGIPAAPVVTSVDLSTLGFVAPFSVQ